MSRHPDSAVAAAYRLLVIMRRLEDLHAGLVLVEPDDGSVAEIMKHHQVIDAEWPLV
jgi:hypothetical protein